MASRRPRGPEPLRGRTSAVVAVLVTTALLLCLAPLMPPTARIAVVDLVQAAAALAAGAACAVRARGVGTDGLVRPGDRQLRLGWRLLGTAAGAWGAGQLVWTHSEVVVGGAVPFPSWADVGFGAAAVLAPLGMALMTRAVMPSTALLRPFLDAIIVCGAAFMLSWNLVLGEVVRTSGDGFLPTALSVAYPVGDVMLVALGLLGLSRTESRRRAGLLTLGGAALAASDIGFVYSSAVAEFVTGSVLDLGWVIGWACIALAALLPRKTGRRETDPRRPLPWVVLLPYTPVALLVVQVAVTDGHDRTADVGVGALVLLVLARQAVTMVDNARLVNALNDRQRELSHLAFTDSLTGLANRASFTSALHEAVDGSEPVVVAFCDVDHFKAVNDRWGHRAGDALLVVVADRLRAAVPGALVARMGGDEFAVLVTGRDAAMDEDGSTTLQVLRHHLLPLVGGGTERVSDELASTLLGEPLRVSTGVITSAEVSHVGAGPAGVRAAAEQLLHLADAQMYQVKRARPHGERRGAEPAAAVPERALPDRAPPAPARQDPSRTGGSTTGGVPA